MTTVYNNKNNFQQFFRSKKACSIKKIIPCCCRKVTSAPFSRLPENRNFRYIVCTLEVSVKGDVQRLPEVRDALGNTSLERLTIKQQLRIPTLPTLTPSPSDSDTTIILTNPLNLTVMTPISHMTVTRQCFLRTVTKQYYTVTVMKQYYPMTVTRLYYLMTVTRLYYLMTVTRLYYPSFIIPLMTIKVHSFCVLLI